MATAHSSNVRTLIIDTNNFTIDWQGTVEGHPDGVGSCDVQVVDYLDVKVGLSAITRVATSSKHLPHTHLLTSHDLNAAPLQVTQRNDNAATVDQNVVPRERCPPVCHSSVLSQRVADCR